MKCIFCEQPLVCKTCNTRFRAQRGDTFAGIYQPEMRVACPACQHLLICKACGFAFGEDEQEDERSTTP